MVWVIAMSESRKERRIKAATVASKESYINSSQKISINKEHNSIVLVIIISVLIVIGIALLIFSVDDYYPRYICLQFGIGAISLGMFFILFKTIYDNLMSIKNYLRSIDEKLDH